MRQEVRAALGLLAVEAIVQGLLYLSGDWTPQVAFDTAVISGMSMLAAYGLGYIHGEEEHCG